MCEKHFIEIRTKDIENSHLDDFNTNVLDPIDSISIDRELLLGSTSAKSLLDPDDFFIRNKINTTSSPTVCPILIESGEGLYSLLFLDTSMKPKFEFVIIQTDDDFVVSERVNQGEEMLYNRKKLKNYLMKEGK